MSGDSDPEDAWYPDDPLPVLLENLSRRLSMLGVPPDLRRSPPSFATAIGELRERLARVRRNRQDLTELERVRVAMVAEDLEHVTNRMTARDG